MSSLEKINLFRTLFYAALVAAIIFLVLAIILFFVFRIPQIYMIKTGRAQKKTIEQMRKQNSETGRLAAAKGHEKKGMSQIFGTSSRLDAAAKTAVLVDQDVAANAPNEPVPPQMPGAAPQQTPDRLFTPAPTTAYGETTLLSNNTAPVYSEPAANNPAYNTQPVGETTMLSDMPVVYSEPTTQQIMTEQLAADTSYGRFEIVRQIVETHTNEVIQ